MKKRPLLLIILVIITTLTLFAFPGAGSATDYVPNTTHTHYSIISSPFNEPITIEKNYNNYADALSAAKNMAHVAMYGADVQSKIATLTNEEFINYLYDGLFHRTPEEAGFAGWLFGLNNGWSRSQVIDYFINSPEFEMRYVYGYSMPPAAAAASVATAPLEVGDLYGGGKVAYIFVDGDPGYVAGQQHGIIAATANISSGDVTQFAWSNIVSGLAITGASIPIGKGAANTTAIIAQDGHTASAAKLCDLYTTGVYSDWFLPSKDELNKLWENLGSTTEMRAANGFVDGWYWSSSEYNEAAAWGQARVDQAHIDKVNQNRVRAVRYF